MIELKKGNVGAQVKRLQLQLNTRLKPSPKLRADGIFGARTEEAVRRFQKANGLAETGVVDPKTVWAIDHPMPDGAPPPALSKFAKQLGTIDDFVQFVTIRETMPFNRVGLIDDLGNFTETTNGRRYLLIEGDSAAVIDFRHFFAAMGEAHHRSRSRAMGMSIGGSPGETVLLGVGLELFQCVEEGIARKINSCFSREDLGSNRLGAAFGEYLVARESEASRLALHQHLRTFLTGLKPVAPELVQKANAPGGWHTVVEVLGAIASGISDILIPRAY